MRELCLADGNHAVIAAGPVDVTDRQPASLDERRDKQHAIRPGGVRRSQHAGERRDFRDDMPAQRRVAAADQVKWRPASPGNGEQPACDLSCQRGGLVLGQAARVREDETRRSPASNRGVGVFVRRLVKDRHDLDVVHGLGPGRIIVENSEKPAVVGAQLADRGSQAWVVRQRRRVIRQEFGQGQRPVPHHGGPFPGKAAASRVGPPGVYDHCSDAPDG